MDTLITSIIIIGIMLFFIIVMFKNIVKRINTNAKKYFINKLNDYDYIVKEKEEEINKLTKEIEELKKEKLNLLQNKKEIKMIQSPIKVQPIQFYNSKTPKYREENFFTNYQVLRNKFDFDKEELIRKFIEEYQDKETEKEYRTLNNFKKKFDNNVIYQLITLSGEDQIEILDKILTQREKQLIEIESFLSDVHKFNINIMLKKLDEMLLKVNPMINVYVNKYDKNYDYIDPYIRTMRYEKIAEGLIIQYKGKSYDFSI